MDISSAKQTGKHENALSKAFDGGFIPIPKFREKIETTCEQQVPKQIQSVVFTRYSKTSDIRSCPAKSPYTSR